MKKIMFMTNGMYAGGAEKVLQTLLHNLDRSKYEITVYSMHKERIDPVYYPLDINYKYIFGYTSGKTVVSSKICAVLNKIRGKMFQIAPSWLFYRLYIRGKYDVEVAFIEGEATKIIAGSSNPKSKKIAWVHTDMIQNSWTDFLYKDIKDERAHYQKFDQVICVSSGVREAFLKKYEI